MKDNRFIKDLCILLFVLFLGTSSVFATTDVWEDQGIRKIGQISPLKPQSVEKKTNVSTVKKNVALPKDISKSFAKEAIEAAIKEGYATQTKDGKFLPKKNIQRHEFVYMVNRAFHFKQGKKVSFSDLGEKSSYYSDASIAVSEDYIYVFKGNRFAPNKYFYRWELPYLLGRALKRDFSNVDTSILERYSDRGSIPPSAKGATAYFVQKGWIRPLQKGKFGATAILKKEEVVYALYRLRAEGQIKKPR